jgi:hypothetical protein
MALAVDWTSWWGVVLTAAAAVGILATAFGVVRAAARWLWPAPPLVSFGHPIELSMPWIYSLGGSDAQFERQGRAREQVRLSSLTIEYLIENKDTTAIRDVTTGLRTADGQEIAFEPFRVQILGPNAAQPVAGFELPPEVYEGMTETNRADNFTYWARFKDVNGRSWEAIYEPRSRKLSYRRRRFERD